MKNHEQTLNFLRISILSLLLILASNYISATQRKNSTQANPSTQLTVSVAASLKEAMEEIGPLYQQENASTKIIYFVSVNNQ